MGILAKSPHVCGSFGQAAEADQCLMTGSRLGPVGGVHDLTKRKQVQQG
jgi:hypothetical protein